MTVTVTLDRRTRVHGDAGGGIVTGGRPLRVLRLDGAGIAALRRWAGTGVVLPGAEQRLARRLHDDGLLLLRAPSTLTAYDVTVVVPAYGRPADLDRCLASLGVRALVVDDAYPDPGAIAAVAARHGARLLRHATNRGPAAARNTGLRAVTTPLVAFVDSDCTVRPGWLDGLLPALLDERVAVVGPRVVGAGGPGLLARFETGCGPLDLGPEPGPVRPGARVGHLPAAVLLCRRALLGDGFDEALRVAEDVDLLWRLARRGLSVRYEPTVVVRHATRGSLREALAQRHLYGRGAALLDRRHPGDVAPAAVGRWVVPVLLGLALGRPRTAAAAAVVLAARVHRQLPAAPGRATESVRLAGAGIGWGALSLLEAGARVGLPALLPACAFSLPARRVTAVVVLTRLVRTRPSGTAPAVWPGLVLAGDVAYGLGVWRGALRQRRPRVLLPRLG